VIGAPHDQSGDGKFADVFRKNQDGSWRVASARGWVKMALEVSGPSRVAPLLPCDAPFLVTVQSENPDTFEVRTFVVKTTPRDSRGFRENREHVIERLACA
jgi:hypothetical protein